MRQPTSTNHTGDIEADLQSKQTREVDKLRNRFVNRIVCLKALRAVTSAQSDANLAVSNVGAYLGAAAPTVLRRGRTPDVLNPTTSTAKPHRQGASASIFV